MEIKINSEKFGKQTVLIDDEDYDKIKGKSLSLFENNKSKRLYVRTSWINGKRFLLHRLITECNKGIIVDHINLNTLDNRKSNLRMCTHAENCRNTEGKKTNKKSKYKGVFIYNKKIIAVIGFNGKPIYLGTFKTEKDAAQAYNDASLKYHGEYGLLNII